MTQIELFAALAECPALVKTAGLTALLGGVAAAAAVGEGVACTLEPASGVAATDGDLFSLG